MLKLENVMCLIVIIFSLISILSQIPWVGKVIKHKQTYLEKAKDEVNITDDEIVMNYCPHSICDRPMKCKSTLNCYECWNQTIK